jgi:hypothetical protein
MGDVEGLDEGEIAGSGKIETEMLGCIEVLEKRNANDKFVEAIGKNSTANLPAKMAISVPVVEISSEGRSSSRQGPCTAFLSPLASEIPYP